MRTLTYGDLLITPPMGTEVGSAAFDRGELALQIGDRSVAEVQDRLYALGAASHGAPRALATAPLSGSPVIDFLRLDNTTAYDDAVFLSRIDVPLDQPLDAVALQHQLQGSYGFDTFALVAYELVEEDGRTGVIVRARPKAFGPNYLQAGLRLNSDFEGDFGADLRLAVLFAPISGYGAEARVLTQIGNEPGLAGELYFPFDPRQRNALTLRAGLENRDINVFDDDGNNVARYESDSAGVVVGWVREFGNVGALQVGWRRASGSAEVETGDPGLPDFDFDTGELGATFTLVRLDNLSTTRTRRSSMAARRRTIGPRMVNLMIWFDNEWGFASRMVDVTRHWLGAAFAR